MPRPYLDVDILQHFATLRALQIELDLSLDELTALWSPVKHSGSKSGKNLFDKVFNNTGKESDAWSYYVDQPLILTLPSTNDDEESSDAEADPENNKLQSRLMGALRLSQDELILYARFLAGEDAREVEVTTLFLNQMYQLSYTGRTLSLKPGEVKLLIERIDSEFPKIEDSTESVQAWKELYDHSLWLNEAKLDVYQWQYLADSQYNDEVNEPFSYQDIIGMAQTLTQETGTLDKTLTENASTLQKSAFNSLATLVGATTEWMENIHTIPNFPALPLIYENSEIDEEEEAAEQIKQIALFYEKIEQASVAETEDDISEELRLSISQLEKAWYVTDLFKLKDYQIKTIMEGGLTLTIEDILNIPNETVVDLQRYKLMRDVWADTDSNRLLRILNENARGKFPSDKIAELTQWDQRQVQKLAAQFNYSVPVTITQLYTLKHCFDLAYQLNTNTYLLTALADTSLIRDDNTVDEEVKREEYTFYVQQAATLLSLARARYDDEQWDQVYPELKGQISVPQRDALADYVMYYRVPDTYKDKSKRDLLTDYLLLDVEMSFETETSRIVQATLSLQMYVQRCLMNLEQGVDPNTIPRIQWEWMKNYRVWEANRKIFLFPESYIEPELRDTKTPFFKELEDTLMQENIEDATVTKVYTQYLDKFVSIADLTIIGSYLYSEDPQAENPQLEPGDRKLYLIGRTEAPPYTFYSRYVIFRNIERLNPNPNPNKLALQPVEWGHWKEIDIAVDSHYVTPVYAFGRLFIFWGELKESKENCNRRKKPGEILTNAPKTPKPRGVYQEEGGAGGAVGV